MSVCVFPGIGWRRRRRSVDWSPGSYSFPPPAFSLYPPPLFRYPPPPTPPPTAHPPAILLSLLSTPSSASALYFPSYCFLTHLLSHSLRLYPGDDCQVQFDERTPDCTVSGGFVRSSTGVGSFFNVGNDDRVHCHPDCCCHCPNVQWIL